MSDLKAYLKDRVEKTSAVEVDPKAKGAKSATVILEVILYFLEHYRRGQKGRNMGS